MCVSVCVCGSERRARAQARGLSLSLLCSLALSRALSLVGVQSYYLKLLGASFLYSPPLVPPSHQSPASTLAYLLVPYLHCTLPSTALPYPPPVKGHLSECRGPF